MKIWLSIRFRGRPLSCSGTIHLLPFPTVDHDLRCACLRRTLSPPHISSWATTSASANATMPTSTTQKHPSIYRLGACRHRVWPALGPPWCIPYYMLNFLRHSLGPSNAAMLTIVIVLNLDKLGAIDRGRNRCYTMALARCLPLNLDIRSADLMSVGVLQVSENPID